MNNIENNEIIFNSRCWNNPEGLLQLARSRGSELADDGRIMRDFQSDSEFSSEEITGVAECLDECHIFRNDDATILSRLHRIGKTDQPTLLDKWFLVDGEWINCPVQVMK